MNTTACKAVIHGFESHPVLQKKYLPRRGCDVLAVGRESKCFRADALGKGALTEEYAVERNVEEVVDDSHS